MQPEQADHRYCYNSNLQILFTHDYGVVGLFHEGFCGLTGGVVAPPTGLVLVVAFVLTPVVGFAGLVVLVFAPV